MFGLFDDLLQQPLTLLQAGDFSFVVSQRPSEAHAFVAEGGAGRVGHHHRAQLLLVELEQTESCSMKEEIIKSNHYKNYKVVTLFHNIF